MQKFQNNHSDPKTNAQRNLMGRTHYVDPDTLRFHKARILSARAVCDGLLFAIVESVALDMHNTKRGVRFTIFDLFGKVVGERASLDACWSRREAATKAMWKELEKLDPRAITLDGIARANRSHESDMDRVRELLKAYQGGPADTD